MSVFEKKVYRAGAWALVFGYMGLIFWLSHQPSIPVPMWFLYQDKLYHFVEYHLLAFSLAHAYSRGTQKNRFLFAFLIAAAYGITDELHQSFVPGRDCSFWDWLADALGAWTGAYLYLKSENVLKTRHERSLSTTRRAPKK